MRKEDSGEILNQVRIRLRLAEKAEVEGDIEGMDKELAELRDLLDDFYDRPDEKIIEPDSAAGQ